MYRLLDLAGPEQAGEVRQFLAKPPEIRSRRLASNRGVTFADALAVATPLLAADGSLIAAISAATDDPAEADSLDDPGEELKKAIATPGPDTASAALNKLSSGRSIRLGTLTSLAAAGVYPNVALKSCRCIRCAIWLAGSNSGYVGAGRRCPRARRREPVSLAVDWHGLGLSGGARRAGTIRLGATCGRRRR
jgi:hypothetical protein